MELCRLTLEQFSENTTVSGVAQSVVHKIVRMHQEQFEVRKERERKTFNNDCAESTQQLISFLAWLGSLRVGTKIAHSLNFCLKWPK